MAETPYFKANIELGGSITIKGFEKLEKSVKSKLFGSVRKALASNGNRLKKEIQSEARKNFKIKDQRFLKSIKYDIFNKFKDAPADLRIRSGIDFMPIHENGGTINKKLMIPLTNKNRIGKKTFKLLIDNYLKNGNAYFKRIGRSVFIFLKNTPENQNFFSKHGFKIRFKKATGKSISKKMDVPIAIIVNSVKLKNRIDIVKKVQRNINKIKDDIISNINAL